MYGGDDDTAGDKHNIFDETRSIDAKTGKVIKGGKDTVRSEVEGDPDLEVIDEQA